ncbi:complement factor H-like [Branchiostoma floridae x Branchiostoma belcheri]
MIRLQVQLALVLIAALVWQSEAWFWRSRRSSRRTSTSVCSHPPTGRGVVREGCRWPYQEGETCEFECRDGFRRTSGDTSRDCNGGTWTGQPLVCENTGCDPPQYIRGSSRTGCRWPYENGDSCSYTCWNGYTAVSGDSVITCNNRTWSGTPLTCEYTGCQRPPHNSGSWSRGCRWPYGDGDSCSYTCWNGFTAESGDAVITCNNRTWSGTPLICVYTGCQWPSYSWYSSRQGCSWPYENGENCSYTCWDGYSVASGDTTITCVNGAWSGTPLRCRRTSGCNHPFRRSGSLGPRNCRRPYEEGETCTFRCRHGFQQQSGNTSITCTAGQWTGDPLVCTWSTGRRG